MTPLRRHSPARAKGSRIYSCAPAPQSISSSNRTGLEALEANGRGPQRLDPHARVDWGRSLADGGWGFQRMGAHAGHPPPQQQLCARPGYSPLQLSPLQTITVESHRVRVVLQEGRWDPNIGPDLSTTVRCGC